MALPRLREELDLLPGSPAPDGQPHWLLHDPVRNQFFRIDWPTLEILQRWDLDDPALIAADVSSNTTLALEADDVQAVIRFLESHHLTQASSSESAPKMAAQLARIQGTALNWLLHHYLFFRIPLLKPDAWLTRWLPIARWFVQPIFAWLTMLGGLGYSVASTIMISTSLIQMWLPEHQWPARWIKPNKNF